jgi:hypothetical protein
VVLVANICCKKWLPIAAKYVLVVIGRFLPRQQFPYVAKMEQHIVLSLLFFSYLTHGL